MSKKLQKRRQKAWRTVAQDHFKRMEESVAANEQNIKKSGLDRDFCTVVLEWQEVKFSFFIQGIIAAFQGCSSVVPPHCAEVSSPVRHLTAETMKTHTQCSHIHPQGGKH